MKKNLNGKNFEELKKELFSVIEKEYRVKQIYDWIYKKYEINPKNMTNIPKELRQKLNDKYNFSTLDIIEERLSEDNSRKYLLGLRDGKKIEAVFIPQRNRSTICLSSQVGCKYDCKFCLTGKMGFIRNLEYDEIISQLITVLRVNKKRLKDRVNIVFMGMGEPFDNYFNLSKALKMITDSKGIAMSSRRITVSTIGIIDKLKKFLQEFPDVKLAISLNSPFPKKRGIIMPVEKKYPLLEIIDLIKKNRNLIKHWVTFEYIMLKGVNDSIEDAKKLEKLTRGIPRKINLIIFNDFKGAEFSASEEKQVEKFANYLRRKHNVVVTLRESKGQDIKASCGNLYA